VIFCGAVFIIFFLYEYFYFKIKLFTKEAYSSVQGRNSTKRKVFEALKYLQRLDKLYSFVSPALLQRPWPEFESNYQIMFKVGMGDTPKVPDWLSDEGHSFLEQCLQHDPHQRASANELLEDTFVKFDSMDGEGDLEDTNSMQTNGFAAASRLLLEPHYSAGYR
jgi:serine/threonine protein kinase